MTHVSRALAEQHGSAYEKTVRAAGHVTAADADANPAFASEITVLKASIDAAKAGHAALIQSGRDGGEAEATDCLTRIATMDSELRSLVEERAILGRGYARGDVSGEEFDRAEDALTTVQRRRDALHEFLPSLRPGIAATSARLQNFADQQSRAEVSLEHARALSSIEIAKTQ